jgi:archaellum component FlaF (FlaF/FlaG flagellin family)
METLNSVQPGKRNPIFSPIHLILSAFLCVITLSGCTEYQYVTVNSNLKKNENKEFSVENDTVSIKYKFSGENFKLSQTIYNKLQVPLYVDWLKTNIIVNGNQISDSIYEDQAGYIAPKSRITIVSNPLMEEFINLKPLETIPQAIVNKGENNDWTLLTFDKTTTPLYFRNFITLTTHDDFTYPMNIDNSFWFSEILQSNSGPSSDTKKRLDQFYLRRTTGFGKVLGWTAGVAVIVLCAPYIVNENPE